MSELSGEMRWDGRLNTAATYPVHQTNVSQHEEVDLEQQSSLRRRIRRYAPNGDAKAMEEAHRKRSACLAVLHAERMSSSYESRRSHARRCILCLSYKPLGPDATSCVAIAASAKVLLFRVLRAEMETEGDRTTPHSEISW